MELEIFNNFQRDLTELSVFDEFKSLQHLAKQITTGNTVTKTRKISGRRFNPLQDLTERAFRYRYRFAKENMRRLIEMLRDDLEVETHNVKLRRNQVPVDKQIMAAIRHWGQTEHSKLTARLHGVSLRTLMKISKRVAEALAAQASRYIRMPCLLVEKEKVTKAFYNLAHMPQVIGIVAHSKVKSKSQTFSSKNENMHVQIVCDANLKIRDIDCRLVADNDVLTAWDFFSQTRIKERFEQNEFRGRLLLGDSSLQCTTFLYTPVSCPLSRPEQLFNHALRLTYEIVHQCFKLWHRRFGILTTELPASGSTARHIIIGLALLHNMAIEWSDPALDDFQNTMFDIINNDQKKVTDNRSRAEFIKNNFFIPIASIAPIYILTVFLEISSPTQLSTYS